MLSFRTIVTIDKSFRDLIKSGTYEKYVFTIINRSEKLFAGRHFTYIVNELDFCVLNFQCQDFANSPVMAKRKH